MSARSVATWNTMIWGCVKSGQGRASLKLWNRMQGEGAVPDADTYAGVLRACGIGYALEEGKRVHKQVIERGYEAEMSVGNALIDMYSKCGSMWDARKVFNRMPTRNQVSWNSMILGYAGRGQGEKVLELSRRMREEGVTPDIVSFVGMLSACAKTRALEEGKRVHEQMIEGGLGSQGVVVSSLVNMYAKCGSMADAWGVFRKTPVRVLSRTTWNAMIMGCASLGEERQALELFQQMKQNGVKPDQVTFVGLLKACGRLRVVDDGRRCHEQVVEHGFESDIFVANGLIDMYGRCGSIEAARRVFDKMDKRNVYTWNTIILEYARCGDEKTALELSERMQREGDPDSFWGLLNISPDDGPLQEGMRVHEQILQRG